MTASIDQSSGERLNDAVRSFLVDSRNQPTLYVVPQADHDLQSLSSSVQDGHGDESD